jgi:hydrogenase nickel incorporation protein HypB
MCVECGCGQPGPTRIDGQPAETVRSPLVDAPDAGATHPHIHTHTHEHTHPHDHTHPSEELPAPGQTHSHPHDHTHTHAHPHPQGLGHDESHPHPSHAGHDHAPAADSHRVVEVHQAILGANDRQAERNRGFFRALNILAVNLVSSPGSGKTELILQTIVRLAGRARVAVIVGDVATDNDARRLRGSGAPVVQITTGTLCHLDAGMVARAVGQLDPQAVDLLFLENVGNLVCPAAFDLGEDLRVALLSVTEGEDKPLKYPPLFHSSQAAVITKTDLAQAAGFDRELTLANLRRSCPRARVFELSARSGEGLDAWCEFLLESRGGMSR